MNIQKLFKEYEAFWKLGRFDKPIGIWLVMFPAFWGLTLGAGDHPSVWYMILFALGAALVRAGGCVVNDLIDHKFDGHVARTKDRPLPKGQVTKQEAMIYAGILLGIAFLILLIFNGVTIFLGFLGVGLIATYPWLKRITYWPQIFLGLMMNWGLVMGVAAYHHLMDSGVILLLLGAGFWTVAYDTIYAFQDIEDDTLLGLKSSAIAMADNPRQFLTWMFMASWLCFVGAGLAIGLKLFYIIGLCAIAFLYIMQIERLDVKNKQRLAVLFRMNQWVGIAMFLGLVL